jgi:hypothetical protein
MTSSPLINEWIQNFKQLGIVTKRGLHGKQHILWTAKGLTKTNQPILHAVAEELKHFTNKVFVCDVEGYFLGSIVMCKDGQVEITEMSLPQ